MENIPTRDLETKRLYIKVPTAREQETLWNILKNTDVIRYYFPTPDRIFKKYNLSKDNLEHLKTARRMFLEQFSNWEIQKPYFEEKIFELQNGDDRQKFTWTIFLKTGEPIGQITIQPNEEYPYNPEIRDIGWFINPKYQGQGYATEAAIEVLKFMFYEIKIEKIITTVVINNTASWHILEKLGFKRTGEKRSIFFDENDNILMSYCYEGERRAIKEAIQNIRKNNNQILED